MADTEVSIFYGPSSWFEQKIGQDRGESLLDIVDERDEAKRRHRHTIDGQEVVPLDDEYERPELVVAESSDYASLNEHAITNFVSLIRSINPETLFLQNPPVRIQMQLERAFSTKEHRYEYPTVGRAVLTKFRDGFAEHLVGQSRVRESLLAALYPLTTSRRTKPVVLLFYGPSGVGKTETAHYINSLLSGSLMRKQFSMFQNDKFASYVFGGAHSESSFAQDLLDRESGVILIDEFDKANAVFHSAFYQLFDDGVFEDKNYQVEVGPALIICTSNYASEDEIRKSVGDALYSRFDSVIRYETLTQDEIVQVIDRIVDTRFELLEAGERAQLDRDALKQDLKPLAKGTGNVRKLGKLINEIMSLSLVRTMLDSGGTAATKSD